MYRLKNCGRRSRTHEAKFHRGLEVVKTFSLVLGYDVLPEDILSITCETLSLRQIISRQMFVIIASIPNKSTYGYLVLYTVCFLSINTVASYRILEKGAWISSGGLNNQYSSLKCCLNIKLRTVFLFSFVQSLFMVDELDPYEIVHIDL